MTILRLTESNHRFPLHRRIFIALTLCCFALESTPNAFGVVPAPDGGYPGANTAEGTSALFSLTSGVSNTLGNQNTATGVNTLYRNTTGNYNTAGGSRALFSNTTGGENTANGVQALFANT